jgi:NAD-dependent DNA ligase
MILFDILTNKEVIDKLLKLDGMALKTASRFAELRPTFIEWLHKSNLQYKLKYTPHKKTNHQLTNIRYVVTGFRNKQFIQILTNIGAIQSTSVSKNIDMVIVKSVDDMTGKMEEAIALKIPIITYDDFIIKYKI